MGGKNNFSPPVFYICIVQGVPIKSAATLIQYYSITRRLAENVKTVLELWGIGL